MKFLQKFFHKLGFVTQEDVSQYLEQHTKRVNELITDYNIKINQLFEKALADNRKAKQKFADNDFKRHQVELMAIHQTLKDSLKKGLSKVDKEIKDQRKILSDFGHKLDSRNKEIDTLKKPYKINGLTLCRGQNITLTASNIPLTETDGRNILSYYEEKTINTVEEKTKNLKTVEDEVVILKEGFENHREKIDKLEHPVIKRKISTPLTNELAKQIQKSKKKSLPSGR